MQPGAAQQQILDKIQKSTNILVAVNASPSVDALAAALGLSLMLNKLDKHTTAVFSGAIPPAINFLEPAKTFENDVNGLRDFIISLDKDKADRLRYKVEEDVVRIFITPYRTTITADDLKFSQGDFNVELIIALGVEKREDLDKAIVAHGRILHDATVVTINANNQQSSLGTIDWHEPNAGSLSEMIISLSDKLQKPGLVDAQISTALLTGLVAVTERFSNQHTTPAVMTMAAQMMAAGANQQLVANNLQSTVQGPLPEVSQPANVTDDGDLEITHTGAKIPKVDNQTSNAEKELEAALPTVVAPSAEPSLDDLKEAIKQETKQAAKEPEVKHFMTEEPEDDNKEEISDKSWRDRRLEPPTMGSPFSATTAQALNDKNIAEDEERKFKDKVGLLQHGEAAQEPTQPAPTPSEPPASPPQSTQVQPTVAEEPQVEEQPVIEHVPRISEESSEVKEEVKPEESIAQAQPEPTTETPAPAPAAPTLAELEQSARHDLEQAYANQPFNPAGQPREDVGAQESLQVQPFSMPTTEATSQETPVQPNSIPNNEPFAAPAAPDNLAPTNLGGLPPIPPMPQLPISDPTTTAAQIPPMPPALPELPPNPQLPPMPPSAFDSQNTPLPPAPVDPGQFKIPGQQ